MRLLVLGHSDSTGIQLPRGTPTWPEIVRDQVALETGRDVELESVRWAPYRPGALEYALEIADRVEPDLVVLPLASFWCAYSNVRTKVDKKFGPRTQRVYRAAEGFVANHLEGRVIPKSASRRMARKVLGVAPLISVAQFIDIHSELIRQLASRENLQVLVLADHHFNEENRRIMPLIPRAIAEINAAIQPIVAERRLLWDDMEKALQVGGHREEIMMPDGVHMNAEGHKRIAAMVGPLAAEFARSLPASPRAAAPSPA